MGDLPAPCQEAESLSHHKAVKKNFDIKWQDKIPGTEVLDRASLSSIQTLLMQTQQHWAGHIWMCVGHMPDHRPLSGELQHGKRSCGSQGNRFKDTFNLSMKDVSINHNS